MSILTITFVTEAPNTVIRSSRWNTDFDDITTFINNKNLDSTDNIADGGVSTAALANLSVTDEKIAGITTAGKVNGSALTSLSSTPSGAGQLPAINGGVPSGAIIMWGGLVANIPSGYQLCDGTNGTPDLRGKFVPCTAAAANPGAVSGNAYVMPHVHTSPSHNHDLTYKGSGDPRLQTTSDAPNATGTAYIAAATVTIDTVGTATAYALCYIQKS